MLKKLTTVNNFHATRGAYRRPTTIGKTVMTRGLPLLSAALMLASTASVAHAETSSWIVSETTGTVTLHEGSKAKSAARGTVVASGDIVETAAGARAADLALLPSC